MLATKAKRSATALAADAPVAAPDKLDVASAASVAPADSANADSAASNSAADSANADSAVSNSAAASNGEDRRITRSKKALREAFITLMEERGFDGFTVNDLCAQADLNRGTFYNHYQGKEDMALCFENDFIADLEAMQAKMGALTLKDLIAFRTKKKPLPFLVELFDYLRKEGDFLHAVMGSGGDIRFAPRLRDSVCSNLIDSILHEQYRNDPTPFVNYYVAFFASAYLGVIARWIETGMQESSEEMSAIAMRLFFIKPGESIKL